LGIAAQKRRRDLQGESGWQRSLWDDAPSEHGKTPSVMAGLLEPAEYHAPQVWAIVVITRISG
jgi:hypothetical protein